MNSDEVWLAFAHWSLGKYVSVAMTGASFFVEIIVSMFWAIWITRNDDIFRNQPHSLQTCRFVFKQELAGVKLRAKKVLGLQIQLWLDNFV